MSLPASAARALRSARGVAPAVLMLGASVALTIALSLYVSAKLQGDAVVKSVTQEAQILRRIHVNEGARLYARQAIRGAVNQAVADVLRNGGAVDASAASRTVDAPQGKVVVLERCVDDSGGTVGWRQSCRQELDPFLETDVKVVADRTRASIAALVPERVAAAVSAHNREDQDALIVLTSPEPAIAFTEDSVSVTVPMNITTYLANKLGVVSSPESVDETVQVRAMKLFEVSLRLAREDLETAAKDALCGVCDRYPDRRPTAKTMRERVEKALDAVEKRYADELKKEGVTVSMDVLDGSEWRILPEQPFDKAEEEGIKKVSWKAPPKRDDGSEGPVPWQDYRNGEVAEEKEGGRRSGRHGLGADLQLLVRVEDRRTYLPYRVMQSGKVTYEYRPIAVEFVLEKRVWEGEDEKCSRAGKCEAG